MSHNNNPESQNNNPEPSQEMSSSTDLSMHPKEKISIFFNFFRSLRDGDPEPKDLQKLGIFSNEQIAMMIEQKTIDLYIAGKFFGNCLPLGVSFAGFYSKHNDEEYFGSSKKTLFLTPYLRNSLDPEVKPKPWILIFASLSTPNPSNYNSNIIFHEILDTVSHQFLEILFKKYGIKFQYVTSRNFIKLFEWFDGEMLNTALMNTFGDEAFKPMRYYGNYNYFLEIFYGLMSEEHVQKLANAIICSRDQPRGHHTSDQRRDRLFSKAYEFFSKPDKSDENFLTHALEWLRYDIPMMNELILTGPFIGFCVNKFLFGSQNITGDQIGMIVTSKGINGQMIMDPRDVEDLIMNILDRVHWHYGELFFAHLREKNCSIFPKMEKYIQILKKHTTHSMWFGSADHMIDLVARHLAMIEMNDSSKVVYIDSSSDFLSRKISRTLREKISEIHQNFRNDPAA